jgi:hypothetical protein
MPCLLPACHPPTPASLFRSLLHSTPPPKTRSYDPATRSRFWGFVITLVSFPDQMTNGGAGPNLVDYKMLLGDLNDRVRLPCMQ